jgi:hypothetical protein
VCTRQYLPPPSPFLSHQDKSGAYQFTSIDANILVADSFSDCVGERLGWRAKMIDSDAEIKVHLDPNTVDLGFLLHQAPPNDRGVSVHSAMSVRWRALQCHVYVLFLSLFLSRARAQQVFTALFVHGHARFCHRVRGLASPAY